MTELKIHSTVDELPEDWDAFVAHDYMLQSTYLKALEIASPSNIELYFILIYNNNSLCGIALVQHVKLYLRDIFRKDSGNKIVKSFRKFISSLLKGHILVVGNLTQTGQHGIYFKKEGVDQNELLNSLFKGLQQISNHIALTDRRKIRLYLFKDYFLDRPLFKNNDLIKSRGLHTVKVQPNMILQIRSNWTSIDDYYADLNKKYKRRYRRARTKLGHLKEVELTETDIKERSEELNSLYMNVSDNAKLNMFILPEDHFYTYKNQMKENFRVFGFFDNSNLVGFYSLIINGASLETYFLGYDPEIQYDSQLYLNMLYNMLAYGIKNNFNEVIYARTAMEIKSSVGANAQSMEMFMKHTTPWLNAFLRPVFNLLDPTDDWVERHPFNL